MIGTLKYKWIIRKLRAIVTLLIPFLNFVTSTVKDRNKNQLFSVDIMTHIFLMDLYPCNKQNQIFIKIHLGIICVHNFVVIMLFCSSSCFFIWPYYQYVLCKLWPFTSQSFLLWIVCDPSHTAPCSLDLFICLFLKNIDCYGVHDLKVERREYLCCRAHGHSVAYERVIFNCSVLDSSEWNHVNFIWIPYEHINIGHKIIFHSCKI